MKTKLHFKAVFCVMFIISLNANNLQAQYNFGGGKGTLTEPYQIKTAQQLDSLRYFVGNNHKDNHYCLMNDIDLATFLQDSINGWLPISSISLSSRTFQGKFHGNGYKIINLRIYRPNDEYVGLFGCVSEASIDNLGIEITENDSVRGKHWVGGLAGKANSSDISACHVSGTVSGIGYVGGLIGSADYNITTKYCQISYCYTTGKVTAPYNSLTIGNIGGLIGYNVRGIIENSYSTSVVNVEAFCSGGLVGDNLRGSISACYATGMVTSSSATAGATGMVGGLAGANTGNITASYSTGAVYGRTTSVGGLVGQNTSNGIISACYATGSVFLKTSYPNVGGLAGYNNAAIRECYATGLVQGDGHAGYINLLGLVGDNGSSGKVDSCYFDKETTNTTNGVRPSSGNPYLSGNTTAEMMQQATFIGWNFENTWNIKENQSYPYFQWEIKKKSLLKSITINAGTLSPMFNPEVFDYTINVSDDVNAITLNAIPVEGATLSGNIGENTLTEGENTFTFTVTADDAPEHVYTITVTKSTVIPVAGVTLNTHALSLAVNATNTLVATVSPDDATNKNVTWTSRNVDDAAVIIVEVDANGLVTAKSEGSAYVIATTQDGAFKDSCLVTVTNGTGIAGIDAEKSMLKVYPNPVTNQLIIENLEIGKSENSKIEIYTLAGQLVGVYSLAGQRIEINVSYLPKGVYLVKLGNDTIKVFKD